MDILSNSNSGCKSQIKVQHLMSESNKLVVASLPKRCPFNEWYLYQKIKA